MTWFYARLITAIMLLWAILPNPYPYYMLLRVVVCAVGAYSAYMAYQKNKEGWAWLFGLTAALFNPFIPAHLTKEIWMILNGLGAFIFFKSLKEFGKDM